MKNCQYLASQLPLRRNSAPSHQEGADEGADERAAAAHRRPDHRLDREAPARCRERTRCPTQAAYMAPAAAAMKAETQNTKIR